MRGTIMAVALLLSSASFAQELELSQIITEQGQNVCMTNVGGAPMTITSVRLNKRSEPSCTWTGVTDEKGPLLLNNSLIDEGKKTGKALPQTAVQLQIGDKTCIDSIRQCAATLVFLTVETNFGSIEFGRQ